LSDLTDGIEDFWISSTTAEVAREVMLDLIIRRVWVVRKELFRYENESRCAKSTLKRRVLDEGLLDGIQYFAIRQTLNRRDLSAVGKDREIETTGNCHAVHEHRAATTDSLATTFACTIEIEAAAQDVLDRFRRLDLCLDVATIQR
jgi:hypothetical protein